MALWVEPPTCKRQRFGRGATTQLVASMRRVILSEMSISSPGRETTPAPVATSSGRPPISDI